MGASANSFNGALPGLTLKAWALVKSDGTLVRGSNVATTSKTSPGVYAIAFTSALTSANYFVQIRVVGYQPGDVNEKGNPGTQTTAGFNVATYYGATIADHTFYFEAYE